MEQALLLVVFARHPNRSGLKEAVMQRRQALKLFAGLALCPLCASTGFASEGHWSYEGVTGPEKWGGLDAADAACSAGGQQSPLDITAPISARQPPLRISWSKRPDTIVNNGHTIQLDFAEGDILHMGDPAIDPGGLLPTQRAYYQYEGSLTTPPCSETVDWIVLTHPIEVEEDDIARFAKLYPMNARPVQNRDRRFILSSGSL
jgi:carbonic anhydrase